MVKTILLIQPFWVVIYPGISKEMLDYSALKIKEFFGIGW